jgi:alkylation response protein AidB-like acyl-CoA dehydrogenase
VRQTRHSEPTEWLHRRRPLAIAKRCRRRERAHRFDRLIGQNQDIQFSLARAYAELQAADMICRRAAARFDDGKECGAGAVITRIC